MMMFLCVLLISGCTDKKKEENPSSNDNNSVVEDTNSTDDNEQTEDNTTDLENLESEYYKIITFTELKDLLQTNDTNLIYFGASWCGACQSFKPIAQRFAKEKQIHIYFVLIDSLTDEENEALDKIVSFEYIPYVTVYQNGQFVYQKSGVHQYEDLESLVREYKIGE